MHDSLYDELVELFYHALLNAHVVVLFCLFLDLRNLFTQWIYSPLTLLIRCVTRPRNIPHTRKI